MKIYDFIRMMLSKNAKSNFKGLEKEAKRIKETVDRARKAFAALFPQTA